MSCIGSGSRLESVGVLVDTMVGFGGKQAWLAVRDGDPAAIRAALGLADLGEVPWRGGMDIAYLTDDRAMLTPPLPGTADPDTRWVLLVGRWLMRPDVKVDVAELSTTLGTEVQRFMSYRGREMHHWERAADGILLRRFSYLGEDAEVLDWQGVPDATELDLGLPDFDPAIDPTWEADLIIGERDVLRVAGAWSVDPSALDGRPAQAPLLAVRA